MTNDSMSPAAQAVADAFEEAWRSTPEADPYECCVSPVAAALRAAADQVVPEIDDPEWWPGNCCERNIKAERLDTRTELLAIADELEAADY